MRDDMRIAALMILAAWTLGCQDGTDTPAASTDLPQHGAVAAGISGPLGTPVPYATAEELDTFERGRKVALQRFTRATGLGPAFNVTFCASCHERPVTGGGAGLYRNFFLAATKLTDGSTVPAESDGKAGGVIRMYRYGADGPARPAVDPKNNVIAQRNPIPFFGVGLIAELPEAAILAHADPDDADGDGIRGRPNFDRGFVGRFGRKAQTVSIEGFIRGPLKNHLGVTTDPLSMVQKAALPVDSSGGAARVVSALLATAHLAQAAAPDEPNADADDVPDPEMSSQDLFDLVSFAMLLAAPELEPATEQSERGRRIFDRIQCGVCHVPRLVGPRGPLPIYSDLLLHDMGPELADGIVQGVATGADFRTQPLWGIAAVGPYLHDGRAETLESAIRMHGGEARRSRDMAAALSPAEMADLVEFLMHLGGRSQLSSGLIPPGTPAAPVGEYGGPRKPLSAEEESRFLAGRALFDRDHGHETGVGGPRFNGDSCRACHFDPVPGGSGPRGVNVMRHGILGPDGGFVPPSIGTVLHKETILTGHTNAPQAEAQVFEHRQSPHLFGLGLIESIPDAVILANADPDDLDPADGISGKPSWSDGSRLGRFGWKAQVPSISEFVRDAVATELGMTLPYQPGHTFGRITDDDTVPDPEMSLEEAGLLADYLRMLAPPPRQPPSDAGAAARGEAVFDELGCAACHIPALDGDAGPVPLYSDLLLHEILPPGAPGIEEFSAGMREFRTAPLWGLSRTAPYLHNGSADTVTDAIAGHDGEARTAREAWDALSATDRTALLTFLGTL